MTELFVFRAGKYPQGNWSVDRVRKFVEAYDPENNIEAPVVIGHRAFALRDSDQYAHGWVSKLRMDEDGKVYATIVDLTNEAKQAIAEKKLRYVSAEIYENDKKNEDEPPYLRAVALLGRDTPAVVGTRIPVFSRVKELVSGGVMQTADEENHVTTFARKLSDREVKSLSAFAEEISTQEAGMELEERVAALEGEVKKLKEELEALKKEDEAKEAPEADASGIAASRKDAEAYFGKLRDAGKLPPAQFAKAVALDARLDEAERKEYRAMFAALAPKVDLSGEHKASKANAPAAHQGNGSELAAQIWAYKKEKNLASFADAAAALFTAKPELFEGETDA